MALCSYLQYKNYMYEVYSLLLICNLHRIAYWVYLYTIKRGDIRAYEMYTYNVDRIC